MSLIFGCRHWVKIRPDDAYTVKKTTYAYEIYKLPVYTSESIDFLRYITGKDDAYTVILPMVSPA